MDTRKKEGTALWRFSQKFQFAAEKIIPDPLVFCLILTVIIYVCGLIFTKSNAIELLTFWYDGFWSQIAFAFQMSFMVITCAVTARSNVVQKLLNNLSKAVKTPTAAIIFLLVFGYVTSFFNWAFCTIVTPIFAMFLAKRIKGLHFPMLVAAGYATMILGQCLAPTASLYALLASPDHFLVDKMGVLTQDVTVYNRMNIVLFLILAVATILITIATQPPKDSIIEFHSALDDVEPVDTNDEDEEEKSFANAMNGSKLLMYFIGIAGIVIIINTLITKGFMKSLSLNFIIFFFMTLNCIIYNSPKKFITAYRNNMHLATDVMIQFPFYGGISGIMTQSGLGQIIVGGFVSFATAHTLPVFTYLSASIINLFIPSQGGQWIVQGDIMVDAALQVKANMPYVVNAFVLGDEATNLLQPLYVIPALSVVGMKLKDVWGFMAFIWLICFIITTIGLYVLPLIV